MTDPIPATPAEGDQPDQLNRYLDDLTRGLDRPAPDIDPVLTQTVHRLHALAEVDAAATDSGADQARLWATLMGPTGATTVARTALHGRGRPIGIAHTYPTAGGRLGGGPLRVAASVAAVLVLVISALSLYQRVPGQGSTPTVMAAGFPPSSTSQATESATFPSILATTADGAAYARPYVSSCTGPSAAYDDVMEVIVGKAYPFGTAAPIPRFATAEAGPNGTLRYRFPELPAGGEVSRAVVLAASETYGRYVSCDGSPLRQAALLSERGLAREYWGAPSIEPRDGGIDGDLLATLWADAKGRRSGDSEDVGSPSRMYLYAFRELPDGAVAALLSRGDRAEAGDLPTFENAGYVVFVEEDGRWVIDEQLIPEPSLT